MRATDTLSRPGTLSLPSGWRSAFQRDRKWHHQVLPHSQHIHVDEEDGGLTSRDVSPPLTSEPYTGAEVVGLNLLPFVAHECSYAYIVTVFWRVIA